jgi:hypothetical protein
VATFFLNDKLAGRAGDANALIVHPHAQRTGGNTIRRLVLEQVYGRDGVYSRMYKKNPVIWKDITDAELAGMRAFADHFDFRENKVTRPLLPIAVLRHPLYRAVSLYHFVKRKKKHKDNALAANNDMETFYILASEKNPRYYRNLQCRRICNVEDARVALETLDAKFLGVGFTENLRDFVGALGGLLRWPTLDVSDAEPDAERYEPEITQSFRERVLADNAEDLVLFETMRNGPPYSLPLRTPREEARTLVNRAKQWAKRVMEKK